jgi:phenylpropionate dioxygenase-like ring-hydroxylating dioxygenase large terminal subunit
MTDSPAATHRDLFARLLERAKGVEAAPEPLAYRIPVDIYTDQDRYQQERQKLLLQCPLILAHESQIPEAGDAIVHDWLGLPLITVRDKSGAIGTFMNVCRHRGMRLVDEPGQQNLRSFVCPYHQWTYGLDGQLRNIPLQESFADIDPAEHNLVSLPTEVRHGLIWLQATPGREMQLDKHLAGIGADLDAFGVPDMHFFKQHERRIACNWKLVQDAFLDGYHVVRLHKNTVGPFFPDCMAASDQLGDHVRSCVGRNEIFEAAEQAPEQWDMRRHCTFSYTLFPNSVAVMHPDYTSLISLYPTAPDQTIFVHTMLVPEPPATDKAQAHYERSFDLIDGGVFQAEDIHVCVGAQAGMASGANTEYVCGAHEQSLQMFHEAVANRLN